MSKTMRGISSEDVTRIVALFDNSGQKSMLNFRGRMRHSWIVTGLNFHMISLCDPDTTKEVAILNPLVYLGQGQVSVARFMRQYHFRRHLSFDRIWSGNIKETTRNRGPSPLTLLAGYEISPFVDGDEEQALDDLIHAMLLAA